MRSAPTKGRFATQASLAILGLLISTSVSVAGQTLTTIYRFTGPDGGAPYAGLVMDKHGSLYGTTLYGGSANYGTVFQITPSGVETVLHNFIMKPDGGYPQGPLILDNQGNLFGTTGDGGTRTCTFKTGCGTVFELAPNGKESVFHTFLGIPDGSYLAAGLSVDANGNLYGTTYFGGVKKVCLGVGCGTVFRISPDGKETVLHRFKFPDLSLPVKLRRRDGAHPLAGLVADAQGNLYGATELGGVHNNGMIFKIAADGKETVLYAFRGKPDGDAPYGNLVLDARGNLFGTTYAGGAYDYGTIFKLSPQGKLQVLYTFTDNADGAHPAAGVVFDGQGNMYGTASFGGHSWGTVFRLSAGGTLTTLYTFQGQADGATPISPLIFDSEGNLYGTTAEGGNFGTPCTREYGCGTVFKLTP